MVKNWLYSEGLALFLPPLCGLEMLSYSFVSLVKSWSNQSVSTLKTECLIHNNKKHVHFKIQIQKQKNPLLMWHCLIGGSHHQNSLYFLINFPKKPTVCNESLLKTFVVLCFRPNWSVWFLFGWELKLSTTPNRFLLVHHRASYNCPKNIYFIKTSS